MGADNSHLDGQYYKLPNKLSGINQYGAAKSGNFGVVTDPTGVAAVTSNRTLTHKPPPEPAVYPEWTPRQPLKTLPPPLDEGLGTMDGHEQLALTPRPEHTPRAPASTARSASATRRRETIGPIRIQRFPSRSSSKIVDDVTVGKKEERMRATVAGALEVSREEAMRRLESQPALLSREEKLREKMAESVPVFRRPISPKSHGHLPGYKGHVPKDMVNIEHTLADRSLRNFSDPYNPGHGTRDGYEDPANPKTRHGPATSIQRDKNRSRGRAEATFVDDDVLREKYLVRPSFKTPGREHQQLDESFHTDAKRNMITKGTGGHKGPGRIVLDETEERKLVPGYTGHVQTIRKRFANSYGDTTMHILTNPKYAPRGDVPFNAKPGDPRPEYGYLKLRQGDEAASDPYDRVSGTTTHRAKTPRGVFVRTRRDNEMDATRSSNSNAVLLGGSLDERARSRVKL
jgi:hypothetical protein